MRGRKPRVHREHTRLDAKSQDHEHHDEQQQRLVAGDPRHVQRPAGGKGEAGAVKLQKEDAQQRQRGAEHGVDEVLNARCDGFLGLRMQHQRKGKQGHRLVEHVQRHDRARKRKPHQRRECEQVKGVEPALVLLVRHVFKRVEADHRPHERDQRREQLGDAVRLQEDGDGVGQVKQRQLRLAPE